MGDNNVKNMKEKNNGVMWEEAEDAKKKEECNMGRFCGRSRS
jgi:hypothetical protein